MPWKALSPMSLRLEFVTFALAEGANIAELCRRFHISRKTGYKWIQRFVAEGCAGVADRCRRPKTSPNRTSEALEHAILDVRRCHRAWGGRKIRQRLQNLGWSSVPAASTITAVLRRNGGIDPVESLKHKA